MARTLAVHESHDIDMKSDDVFARTLPVPLTTIFSQWYGPIPPVAEVREQQGQWGTPGRPGWWCSKAPAP